MEALADMEAVPSWSSVHKRVEVVDKHPDGRPHHVKVSIAVTGIHDTEMLECHWGPSAPLPEFWINRARKKILRSALEGLRQHVMGAEGSGSAK